jgi:hypothetical protein
MNPSPVLILLVTAAIGIVTVAIAGYLFGRYDGRRDERRRLGVDFDVDDHDSRPATVAARMQQAQTVQPPARMTAAPAAPPAPNIGPKTPDH